MSFSGLGLTDEALRAVKSLGYENPTPVQEESIPQILEGHDVIAAASTGTGKTAAFLLPLVSILSKPSKNSRAPRILVVSPTRELAEQISGTAFKICRACGQFVTTVFGGTSYSSQIRNLRRGCDVLIATPGRLCDLIERGVVDLSHIQAFVLDEADRMLDMGFIPDIKRIVEKIPNKRQTLLFSATIDSAIRNNFDSLLKDPVFIQIAQRGETAELVDQFIIPVSQKDKPELLKCLLDEKAADKVIIFARTRSRVQQVHSMLKEAGFKAVSIHSDKTQGQRREALTKFRKGKANIIVATDVLARGIDVPEVDYVINYDLPDMAEDYIHRIGRTGRAGERGFAVSFASNNSMKALNSIESLIGKAIPIMRLESYEIDTSIVIRRKSSTKKAFSKKSSNKRYGSKKDYSNNEKHKKKTLSKNTKSTKKTKSKGNLGASSKAKPSSKKNAGYDYTGYGDLRRGKKHSSSSRSKKRPGWKSGSRFK